MNRTTRVLRLRAALLRGEPLLDAAGWGVELNADTRTIQRDLAYLRKHQGMEIVYNQELKGYRCEGHKQRPMQELKAKKWARLMGLIHRIAAQPGQSSKDLAETTGRSERTIFRDLRELENLGFPLYNDDGYRFAADAFFPTLGLQPRELLALFTGARMLESVAGAELASDARLALEKLLRATAEEKRPDLGDLRNTVQVEGLPEDTGIDLLLELQSVIGNGHQIRLSYQGIQDEKAQERVVDPMGLFGFRQVWYLRAYDHNRSGYRSFRLSRVRDWEQLEAKATHPAQMDIQEAVYHRWDVEDNETVTVELSVCEALARWLTENPPHPSQQVNGDLVTYEVSDLVAVARWVASLHGVEVLQPLALRQEMGRLAEELLERYGSQILNSPH